MSSPSSCLVHILDFKPSQGADLYLRPERIGIAVQDVLHSRLSCGLIVLIVAAAHTVAVVAIPPAGEALAVELQAARVLAVAVLLAAAAARGTYHTRT